MNTVHQDIEDLLAVAGDDHGRPLSFAMDDIVRQGRRRRRIRRAGTLTAAAVTAVALATGTLLWLDGNALSPADADRAQTPVAAVAGPPVIEAGTWTEVADGAWFTISRQPAGANGLGIAGVHARFADRPGPHDPQGPGSALVFTPSMLDRGYRYPAAFVGFAGDGPASALRSYPVTYLRGDIHSGVYTTVRNGKPVRERAKIYRLAPVPGWVLVVGPSVVPGTPAGLAPSLEAYDAQGKPVVTCSVPRAGSTPSCTR